MVLIDRGSIAMGPSSDDSISGIKADPKGISVDAFWMDETEITNSKYKQFVFWVRDSIIRERLADPAFGGDEAFKIEEDREGNPITPLSQLEQTHPLAQSQRRRAEGLSRASTAQIPSPDNANSTPPSSTTDMKSTTIRPPLNGKTGSTRNAENTTPTAPCPSNFP